MSEQRASIPEQPPVEVFDEVFAAGGEEPPFWLTTRSSIGWARSKAEALRLVDDAYGETDEPMVASVVQMYVGGTEDGLTVRGKPHGMTWWPIEFWKVDEQ